MLFYKVPNLIVKCVNGSPIRLLSLSLYAFQNKDSIQVTAVENGFQKPNFIVEIPLYKLFKHIGVLNQVEDYEEELMSMPNRHVIITQAISKYIHKNF